MFCLFCLAKFCGQEMIEILYDHGADPSVLNSFNQSPLHIASSLDRFSIIKKLLSLTQSTLLEIKDKRGHTALSLTTNTDIINELLRFKADISSVNRNHMNVLMIAVSKNQISIVEHLLYVIDSSLNKKLFDQVTKRNNRSIFLLAVETGSIPLCELLLSNEYIRWDTIDRQRMNAFHIAARNNHYELIEFLCNYIQKSDKNFNYTDSDLFNFPQKFSNLRVYLDAQNDDGKTPLHFAAEYGHTLSVEILLKYGADILLTNYLGQLALHTAIQTDHCQCVDLLIRNSVRNLADFQSVLSRKQSPLIMACQNGSIDIVRLLISQDIRTDYNYEEGENPLEIAIKYRQIEVLHELLEHPQTEHWLMPIRETEKSFHQTPLRDMIRSIPECAKHTFDKFIIKTTDTDSKGDTIEKTTYNYKYIDDYFT